MLTFIASATTSVFAQQMKRWNWKTYKVSFELPANWKIGRNDKQQFYASDPVSGMSVRITPFLDKKYNAKMVAEWGVRNNTTIQNKKTIQSQSIGRHNGFYGHAIFMEGTQKGRKIQSGMVGLINPNSAVNIFVRLTWWDQGSQKNNTNMRIAEKIAKSFQIMQ